MGELGGELESNIDEDRSVFSTQVPTKLRIPRRRSEDFVYAMEKDKQEQDTESADVELVSDTETPPAEEKDLVLARQVLPEELPIIPMTRRPIFPGMTVPLLIDNENLKGMLLKLAKSGKKIVGLVLGRAEETEPEPGKPARGADLYRVGVAAEVLQVGQLPGIAPIQVMFGGRERFLIEKILQDEPHIEAHVQYMWQTEMASNEELKAYSLSVVKSLKELIQLNPLHKEEMSLLMQQSPLNEPGRLADFAAALTSAEGHELQEVLETVNIRERLGKVLLLLQKEIDISKIQAKISKQIEEKLSKQQRQFFLREQLKAIKKELGLEKEGKETEIERFEKRLEKLTLTDEARERIDEEMDKLKLIEPSSPEFNVSRTYLDWLTVLPWGIFTEDSYKISKATRILNRDHYGL